MLKPLKENHPINFIHDNEHPIKSANTKLICAWLTCGGKLMDPQGFTYTVEKSDSGEPKYSVTWLVDGNVQVEFDKFESAGNGLYKKCKETVSFRDFQTRFRDSDWSNDNNEHPMAFMFFYKENMHKLIGFLKKTSPSIKIKTGMGVAILSHDTPEHIKQKILKDL